MGRLLAAILGLLCCMSLTGCGSSSSPTDPEADASTIPSAAFSCTDAALQQQKQLRQAVGQNVSSLQGHARLTNDCNHGLDAGVEFHLAGIVRDVVTAVTADLSCTDPRVSQSALGRRTTLRCHVDDLWMRVTLDPYLPASDPKGPSVLGAAYLVKAPSGA